MAKQPKLNFKIPTATSDQKNTSEYSEVKPNQQEKKMNLAALSKLEAGAINTNNTAFNAKNIPLHKIEYNKMNDYEINPKHVQRLKRSILKNGLIHNLEAVYSEERDKYILTAGECRTTAIKELLEDFKDVNPTVEYEKGSDEALFLKWVYPFSKIGVPCNVKSENDFDEIDAEISLIEANEIVRDTDPAFRMKKIERLKELYQQKGLSSNKATEKIAKEMDMSKRQVIKYQNITKLIPELRKAFENSKITLTEGNNISQLSWEEQYNILELINSEKSTTKEELEAAYKLAKKRDEETELLRKEIEYKNKRLLQLEKEKEEIEKNIEEEANKIVKVIENKKEAEKLIIEEKLKKVSQDKNNTENRISEVEKEKQLIEQQLKQLQDEMQTIKEKNEKKAELTEKELEQIKADYQMELLLKDAFNIMVKVNNKIVTYNKEYGNIKAEKIKNELKRLKETIEIVSKEL